jgi:hypothetical protein
MSDSHPLPIQSWADVYQLLRAKAEANRGTVTVAAKGAASDSWPHTSTRDVFAIALVFDTAIDDHTSGTMVARWIVESDLLAGEPSDSIDPYVGNRSFWETLAAAVVELDRAHAPLPGGAAIDDAVRALETARPAAARERRNAAGTMLVTVFAEPSWRAMAVRQLEFFRTLRGEIPGSNPFAPLVPATSNGDVLALADYWTDQLALIGDRASDTFHRLLYSCWRDVSQRVRAECKHAPPHELCAHNPDFWTSLLLLTTQSDACDAAPMPWAFHVPPAPQHGRNATPADMEIPLEFPDYKTWDEKARLQRDSAANLRGQDQVAGRLIAQVPRTTVADVRRLAAYWSDKLDRIGERNFADQSSQLALHRWKNAAAEVQRIPQDIYAGTVYWHNTDFWEAVMTIAIQIAVTDEAPSRGQLIKEAVTKAVHELPQRLKSAVEGYWSNFLAKPLLYLGLGAGTVAVLYLATRGRSVEPRP